MRSKNTKAIKTTTKQGAWDGDCDKLHFPAHIVSVIGLSRNEINHLKSKGCPFYERKTTVRWVREFIAKEAGAIAMPQTEHLQPITLSKSYEPAEWNGSRAA